MASFQGNQFTMDAGGDSSHDNFPGQHIWVNEIHIYGGDNDGNLMLLDTNGTLRAGPGRHEAEERNQLDPRIIASGNIVSDTFTRVPINRKVRGLFLDDIPDGGKLEIYVGDSNA